MDPSSTRTAPIAIESETQERPPLPGLCAVFSGRPLAVPVPAGSHVGREHLARLGVDDAQMSREHFVLEASGKAGRGVTIVDSGSRNGTFVDGDRVSGSVRLEIGSVVRAGRTLFVTVADTAAFERHPTRIHQDVVEGPITCELFARARVMGQLEQLLVTGASGVGKEQAARAFHAGLGPRAPFVALNCATIQAGIAERLLFGARKGVYTGAEHDADGYVHAADGGTLFLDEVAELDLSVQAKLLRFLETREYFPLGEVRPRKATVRVCFATLRDLVAEVAARRFREDLYHRISTPALRIPPLSERKEEIPFLIELQARRFAPRIQLTLSFVERALIARWPGNVRQLIRTSEAAFVTAEAEGRETVVAADIPRESMADEGPTPDDAVLTAEPTDDEIQHAMDVSGGNVSVAARALGVHRSKLRRRLQKIP